MDVFFYLAAEGVNTKCCDDSAGRANWLDVLPIPLYLRSLQLQPCRLKPMYLHVTKFRSWILAVSQDSILRALARAKEVMLYELNLTKI